MKITDDTNVLVRAAVMDGRARGALAAGASVLVDRPAVEAGLAILDRGGDFADGVIAFEGRRLGGPVFTSFDREAVGLVEATSGETRLLSKR